MAKNPNPHVNKNSSPTGQQFNDRMLDIVKSSGIAVRKYMLKDKSTHLTTSSASFECVAEARGLIKIPGTQLSAADGVIWDPCKMQYTIIEVKTQTGTTGSISDKLPGANFRAHYCPANSNHIQIWYHPVGPKHDTVSAMAQHVVDVGNLMGQKFKIFIESDPTFPKFTQFMSQPTNIWTNSFITSEIIK